MKVLISTNYGAGWSTWNTEEMAYDKDLIKLFEHGCTKDEMECACIEKGYVDIYGNGPYMGGFEHLKVVTIEPGMVYQLVEDDGYEYIRYFNPAEWRTAD